MDEFYNHHYIRTDASGNIVEGWSDGPFNRREATEDDICINDKGGYQFRLSPDGEENPPMFDSDMIPLYKWTGSEIVRRTQDEIEADRLAFPEPPPTAQDKLEAQVTYTAMLTDTLLPEDEDDV